MRLLTRADFDGLACAVLLTDLGLMDNWLFVHPKDVQDGNYPGNTEDIVCNVPYIPGCGYWFDHHSSEQERLRFNFTFRGAAKDAKSAARVVWEYFGGREKFGAKFDEMLHFVDKVDSGDLSVAEIENPKGWIMLGFLMDPRTGLGRHKSYTISNYRLMEDLIQYCRTLPVDQILDQPDVKQRVNRYLELQDAFRAMVRENSTRHGNVIVFDIRHLDDIPPGNRFVMYTMHPEFNVSVQVMQGRQKANTVFSVGYSIVNRTCATDIGSLMLKYGGGGHRQVGTCQVPNEDGDRVLVEIVNALMEKP